MVDRSASGRLEPIFIVGCQRSGTTLTASLLGAEARTIAIPEAQFIAELAPADPMAELDLAAVIDGFARHERFRVWGFDLGEARPGGRGRYADAVRWLVRRYAAAEGKPEIDRWIDHQPGHLRAMETLRLHFPALKAVHIVRDGRAVAASLLALPWGPNTIHKAAGFWAQRVAMGLALRDYLADGGWVQLRYEDLLADAETELRRLCGALGLRFDAGMLAGRGFNVPAFTRGQHALVGRPPDASRSAAWRKALSERDVEIFEALVGPLLTFLGYATDYGERARMLRAHERVRLALVDQVRGVVNRRRFARQMRRHAGPRSTAGDRHAPDRVDVGDEIAPEQAARLEREAIGPF